MSGIGCGSCGLLGRHRCPDHGGVQQWSAPTDVGEIYGYVLVDRDHLPVGFAGPFSVFPTLGEARELRNRVGADRVSIAVVREVIVE